MSDFNQIELNTDDPRLTAFALDELEGEECARIAAAVAADPSLQTAVEEIRATAGQLTIALKGELLPESLRPAHIESYRTVRPARMFHFPYWAVAGLAAAACFAFILALRDGPLFEKTAVQDAGKLAGAAKKERKTLMAERARPHQASNHIDIQFPKQDVTGESQTLPAASGTPEQWGVVVPNPPETASNVSTPGLAGYGIAADAAAAPSGKDILPPSGSAADEEVKMAQSEVAAPGVGSTYRVESTLAGTRVRTDLKDFASPAAVAPGGLLSGTGAKKSSDLPAAEAGAGAEGRLVAQEADHSATSGVAAAPARGKPIAGGADDRIAGSDFIATVQNPRSTFPVDVDTASYANVRRFLLDGRRPPRDDVRIEGLVNFFTYDYAAPKPADKDQFAASLEAASAPWAPSHRLVRIGLKARELPADHDPADGSGVAAIVAREVSIQVEFNPARVQAYRLIGYEDGGRRKEDAGGGKFNAGDVGAGHSVTALYEVVPAGVEWRPASETSALRFQTPAASRPASDETSRSPGPAGVERRR